MDLPLACLLIYCSIRGIEPHQAERTLAGGARDETLEVEDVTEAGKKEAL
jgi:hypothetical protein